MKKEILIVEPHYIKFKYGLKVSAPCIYRLNFDGLSGRWYRKQYYSFKNEKEPMFEVICNKIFQSLAKKVKNLPEFLAAEELEKVMAILKMQNVIFANALDIYVKIKHTEYYSYTEKQLKGSFIKIL